MALKNVAGISATALATILLTSPLMAHDGDFVGDSYGKGVKDSYGKCIKSVSGNNYDGCVEKKPEPKPKPKPKPKPPAPAPEPAPAPAPEPVVVEEPAVVTSTLSDSAGAGANFAFDSAKLNANGRSNLDSLVADISDMTVSSIVVVGHTDSKGSKAYNQRLSERRADSVANYLHSKGIDSSLFRVTGRGELQPIASNKTKAGRAQNRRVEITVTGSRIVTRTVTEPAQ